MKPTFRREQTLNSRRCRLAIIGTGMVGTAFGVALKRCGYTLSGVADLKAEVAEKAARLMGGISSSTDALEISKKAALIFITTPDDAIAETCERIASGGGFGKGDVVFHCSGALSSDVLASARVHGAHVASLHPIGVFADVETAVRQLSELYFCLEGDADAVQTAEMIVKDVGGKPSRVGKEQKIYTHIAACLSSNYVVTLANMAVQLLHHLQMSREERLRILMPLFKGSIRALEEKGLPGALTGPIARGDTATIKQHVEALQFDRDLARIYSLLGLKTLPIALEKEAVEKEDSQTLKDELAKYFQERV